MKKRIVVLTGAGISADSGLKTFRDADGLWEGHDVTEVATPTAFQHNPELVLRFYNERRSQLHTVEPNPGHLALVELESKYEVSIITQNVDDLHERAGSSHILHLHGELKKGRSSLNPNLIVDLEGDIGLGDTAPDGSQLRPHIVWFGEPVPLMEEAARVSSQADIFLIIGTSLLVYPAAGLVDFVPYESPVFVVDPKVPDVYSSHTIEYIAERGSVGVPMLVEQLMNL